MHDLLAQLAEDVADDPRVAARHRVEAFAALPDPARAARVVPAASNEAQYALQRGANEEAADLARCALRAWSVCEWVDQDQLRPRQLDAHLVLGHALSNTAPAEADAAYANGQRAVVDDEGRARFLSARGWLMYRHGQYARAANFYQAGLALTGLPPPSRADLATGLGWILARQGLFEAALGLFDQALSLVNDATHPESAAYALDRKGMTLAFLARPTEGLATLERALELATRVDPPTLVASIQVHRGNVCGRLEDWEPALRYLDEAVELTQAINDVYLESVAWWSRTDVLTRMGDLEGALAANQEEERALRLLDNNAHLAACVRRRKQLLDPGSKPVRALGGRTQ